MLLSEQFRILPSSLNAISRYSVCPYVDEAWPLSRISAGCEYSGISYFQGQIACQNHWSKYTHQVCLGMMQSELLNYQFQIFMISQPTIVCLIKFRFLNRFYINFNLVKRVLYFSTAFNLLKKKNTGSHGWIDEWSCIQSIP